MGNSLAKIESVLSKIDEELLKSDLSKYGLLDGKSGCYLFRILFSIYKKNRSSYEDVSNMVFDMQKKLNQVSGSTFYSRICGILWLFKFIVQ